MEATAWAREWMRADIARLGQRGLRRGGSRGRAGTEGPDLDTVLMREPIEIARRRGRRGLASAGATDNAATGKPSRALGLACKPDPQCGARTVRCLVLRRAAPVGPDMACAAGVE